jgi:spore coat polysaccharide biosynthesis protein SpsF
VVATSRAPDDDAVQKVCETDGIMIFRGSEDDVLDRLYRCALHYGMDAFARFSADNPLIDPAIADRVIAFFLDRGEDFDYVSNNHPPTWPDGFEVEIVRVSALEQATRGATQPFQREHATPYIWDQPGSFRIGNVALDDDHLFKQTRWTLDYPEDLEFITRVYAALYPQKPTFGMDDVLSLLRKNPELQRINAHLGGETWYRSHLTKLHTVSDDTLKKAM